MADKVTNVLFLCTGNSARSIMAEAILNRWGLGRIVGYSAGSHPKGAVHPLALRLLEQMHLSTAGLASKSWEEFAKPGAPVMDFVFTVCDDAAREACPVWPGQPITAHWGIPDPAAAEGSEAERMLAFRQAFRMLERIIQLFLTIKLKELGPSELRRMVDEVGQIRLQEAEKAS
jgi:arsenate reductase